MLTKDQVQLLVATLLADGTVVVACKRCRGPATKLVVTTVVDLSGREANGCDHLVLCDPCLLRHAYSRATPDERGAPEHLANAADQAWAYFDAVDAAAGA